MIVSQEEQTHLRNQLEDKKSGKGRAVLFGLAIFSSAFLLFQVQLLLGKFLLPWFGGTSAVWATCLLFFQTVLFAGYYYSHKVSQSPDLRRQGLVHLLFLVSAAGLLLLSWQLWGSPILPAVGLKPEPGSAPIGGILKLLVISIGLPFLALSSTGPLLQKWYYDLRANEASGPPYFLYALSNAGSLIGLISYPILVEPFIGLNKQSKIWGAAFLLFVLCCGACAWIVRRSRQLPKQLSVDLEANPESAPKPHRWLWFLLSASGSVMLLATTNLITQDVAPVPLLWVVPLSLYLLTFIFAFQTKSWYFRGLFHPLFAVTALLAVIALFRGTQMTVLKQLGLFLGMLFAACMVCHGELAKLKPAGKYLTAFYLTIAGGGAFGGIFVGIIAPRVFPAIWEYHIALWTIAVLLGFALLIDKRSWIHEPRPDSWVPLAFFSVAFLLPKYLERHSMITIPPSVAAAYNFMIPIVVVVLAGATVAGRWLPRFRWPAYKIIFTVGVISLTTALIAHAAKHSGELVWRSRNFYGALSVQRKWDDDMVRSNVTLMHGRIVHGIQIEQDRKLATTYYSTNSGIGLMLLNYPRHAERDLRVGAIGLGVGTVAVYARPGDVYHFYEINPAVIHLAQGAGGYFSFLRESLGKIEIEEGDARLCLEREAARREFQNFDLLIVDAFNGDSIPIHLLTREAMKLYLSHLRDHDSVIAVHISNMAVDLAPVVSRLATFYGLRGAIITATHKTGVIAPSEWILLTRGNSLNVPAIQAAGKPILAFGDDDDNPLWTDDYTNVLSLLRDLPPSGLLERARRVSKLGLD